MSLCVSVQSTSFNLGPDPRPEKEFWCVCLCVCVCVFVCVCLCVVLVGGGSFACVHTCYTCLSYVLLKAVKQHMGLHNNMVASSKWTKYFWKTIQRPHWMHTMYIYCMNNCWEIVYQLVCGSNLTIKCLWFCFFISICFFIFIWLHRCSQVFYDYVNQLKSHLICNPVLIVLPLL